MLAIGAGGIIWQQWTGQVSELLLGVYVLLLGGPAVGGLWSLWRGVAAPTTGSSSPSPAPPSSQGSSTGLPPASDGDVR